MTSEGSELRPLLSLVTYWRPGSEIRWFRLTLGKLACNFSAWPIILLSLVLLAASGYSTYRLERLWRANRTNYRLLTETRAKALGKEEALIHKQICLSVAKDPGFKVILDPPLETKTHPLDLPVEQLEPLMRTHHCGTVTVALTNGWRVQAWVAGPPVNVVIPPKYLLVKRWVSGAKWYYTSYFHYPAQVQIVQSGRILRSLRPQSSEHYYVDEHGRSHRLYIAHRKIVAERLEP